MKCKHCQAELEEGVTLCPVCGKEQDAAEEQAAPAEETPVAEGTPVEEAAAEEQAEPAVKEGIKATPGKIALAIAAGVVVLAVLVALVISGIDGNLLSLSGNGTETVPSDEATAAPTEVVETVPATIPPDGNPDDVTCKGTYTVADEEAAAAADTVVATIGDAQLTNGQLQVYYWMEVYNFLQEYGDYAAYFGMDYTQPLDTQLCEVGDVSTTWQQYFLQCALDAWASYQALVMQSEEEAYELPEGFQEYLDSMPEQLEEIAVQSGYANLTEQVLDGIGAGATAEDYVEYARLYERGYMYFVDQYEKMQPTAEEVEAYFVENEAAYTESGVTRDSGKYVDVRHILLMPNDENATTGEDGYPVYSEEAWEACRVEAQQIYDEWMKGDMSEDSFAQFAAQYSVDGSASSGGLYTDVYEGQMVENFENWCFDEARQVGDHGLVQTQYGYHIMYFVGSRDIWFATAESDLISEKMSTIVPAAMEKFPATIDYSAIKLGLVSLA